MKIALTIAGSDPTGGAGLQADLQVFRALGVHGMGVVTALTVQDTGRVHEVLPVFPSVVLKQLRAAKRDEIARVNAAIRGESDALSGSPVGKRDRLALADLLAWRAFVESVPEWPIDVSTLTRSVLYVVIPLLGWVGAALVQHVLESALASR